MGPTVGASPGLWTPSEYQVSRFLFIWQIFVYSSASLLLTPPSCQTSLIAGIKMFVLSLKKWKDSYLRKAPSFIEITDIKHCVNLKYIMCWLDTLIWNTFISSHSYHFLFMVKTFKVYSLSIYISSTQYSTMVLLFLTSILPLGISLDLPYSRFLMLTTLLWIHTPILFPFPLHIHHLPAPDPPS